MPNISFQYEGKESTCGLGKVDRSKLYGYSKTEVLDEDGKPCTLATLAADGRTVIPSGGVALAYFSPDGLWKEKSDLKAVDVDGEEIKPVSSTLKAPVELSDTATFDEFLTHNIRLIYQLDTDEENTIDDALIKALDGGTIFTFSFSYRGGLSADTAFLIKGHDGTPWMLVGKETELEFIGFEQTGSLSSAENDGDSTDDDEELISFDF